VTIRRPLATVIKRMLFGRKTVRLADEKAYISDYAYIGEWQCSLRARTSADR